MRQLVVFVAGWMSLTCAVTMPASGETRQPWHTESAHFLLHTDLPPTRAVAYLERMEGTLQQAAAYWGRPSPRRIECYLIDDLKNWQDEDLPHALARVVVGGIGGVTITQPSRARGEPCRQALIYASTDAGVVEHEIMHAYCTQNFEATGPEWYKEGMAELASFGEMSHSVVRCPDKRLAGLRRVGPRSTTEIRQDSASTKRVSRSLEKLLVGHRGRDGAVSLQQWTSADLAEVQAVRDEYVWNWALCHFLHHNPNYRDRFRMVGESYVGGRRDTFEQVFSSMAGEMMFEFSQFVTHVNEGYRADLCRWDWHRRFSSLERVPVVSTRCVAARGWQPAELLVQQGRTYAFEVAGTWSTGDARAQRTAPGHAAPVGSLLAVVLKDYQLSEPLVLGRDGRFIAPASGKLYLRCHDHWSQLADNRGEVQVRFFAPEHPPLRPTSFAQ